MRKLALLFILVLTGCAAAPQIASPQAVSLPTPGVTITAPSPAPAAAETEEMQQEQPEDEPAGPINPLTGLPPDDPALLNRRPVMVKVSNYPRYGRPHAGLSSADMVFEYYIGEMFNRFLAVYYGSDSSRVGPIRSGRLVDAQLADQFQGILVYGNADDRVDEILADKLGERAMPTKFGVCPPICGTDTHSVVGVFVDTGVLSADMNPEDGYQPDLSGFVFDSQTPEGGMEAHSVAVQYAEIDRGEWRFDIHSGRYQRWIEELDEEDQLYMAPLVDRNTDEHLAFDNVVLLSTFYVEYNRTLHNIDMTNNHTGLQALIFRDGNLYQGLWRSNDDSGRPFQLLDPYGNPFPLKPGKTWFVLAGISSEFKQPEPGSWELLFYLP